MCREWTGLVEARSGRGGKKRGEANWSIARTQLRCGGMVVWWASAGASCCVRVRTKVQLGAAGNKGSLPITALPPAK